MFKTPSMPLLRKFASSISQSPLTASPVTTSPVSSSEGSPAHSPPSSPTYRGPVHHSGWVWKTTSRLRGRSVRRFFELRNSLLSSYHSAEGSPSWTVSVSHATVHPAPGDRLQLLLRTRAREVRFAVGSAPALAGWADALRRGAACNLTDFYRLGAQVGAGSFGAVRAATEIATGAARAVKVVERTRNAKELEFIARETRVVLAVAHAHVVATHDVFDAGDRVYVVMDFVPHGDLFDLLALRGRLPEGDARSALRQILDAVAYLHAQGIVHRDIKPENILVARLRPLHLQLTDFGFARFGGGGDDGDDDAGMVSVVGTGCYMPPEVIDERGHGRPVDLFACGVVLFRMLTGALPFEGGSLRDFYNQALLARAVFASADWTGVSERAQALNAALLDPDPDARPTADAALRHPWFAGRDVDGDKARPAPAEIVVDRDKRGVRRQPPPPPGPDALLSRASAPAGAGARSPRAHADTPWNAGTPPGASGRR